MGEKSLDRLYIGNRSAGLTRAYIQFATMPTIPEGSTITSAIMTLHLTSGTSTAANASAYMVTGGEWASGTIQWSNMPAANVLMQGDISHNNVTGYTFSCLTAVQAWYNGDPTGQHNNYGIMLKYANESVADYNAVYSADCTDANKRPSLSIIYQTTTSTVDVLVGNTRTLTVSDYTGTITWSSNNTTVATVSSSGVVTALQAGKAVVTAYAGTDVLKTFAVYVRIQDGVYSIKSASSGLYLGTYGSIAENTPVKLFAQATSGLAQVRQLWKITYLGDGYYSIRPAHELKMVLHTDGNAGSYVDIISDGAVDKLSAISPTTRWVIEGSAVGSGINLKHGSSGGLSLKLVDGSVSPGMGVTTASNTGTYSFEWVLSEEENPPCGPVLYEISTGKIINDIRSRYIAAGTSKSLAELDLAIYSYSENATSAQGITWSCTSGSSHIMVNQSTGSITALSKGTALVKASNSYGSIDLYITVTGSTTTDFTFINHYDASFMIDPDLVGYIDDAVAFVNTVYQREFGVSFSSSTDPYYRAESIIDQCPLEVYNSCHYENNECEGMCNSFHHKNIYRISDHLYSSTILQDHVVVLWSDCDNISYCMNDKYVFSELGAIVACVLYNRPTIHMMTIDDTDDNRLPCMAINLAHEFAHTVGMDDKYTDPSHSTVSWNCIMEGYDGRDTVRLWEYYESLKSGATEAFCSSCKAELTALLASSS